VSWTASEREIVAQMLQISDVSADYNGIHALRGVSLEVHEGETLAVLGANGAGKSTLLKVISGSLAPSSGEIVWQGHGISGWPAHRIARSGILSVPEGRKIFPGLTVEENLQTAVFGRSRQEWLADLEPIYGWLPWIRERRTQLGWSLSGGQQQMLAIARALMGRPRLLLLDEPSLGLSPVACAQVFELMGRIRERGVAMLLVEQNAAQALEFASRAVVLELGGIVLEGTPEGLRDEPLVRKAYLAV
jgi:branched-chain amino acid transport system ATP-binding protein